jgi:hypothetical protein
MGEVVDGWLLSPLYEVILVAGAGIIGFLSGSAVAETRMRNLMKSTLVSALRARDQAGPSS